MNLLTRFWFTRLRFRLNYERGRGLEVAYYYLYISFLFIYFPKGVIEIKNNIFVKVTLKSIYKCTQHVLHTKSIISILFYRINTKGHSINKSNENNSNNSNNSNTSNNIHARLC